MVKRRLLIALAAFAAIVAIACVARGCVAPMLEAAAEQREQPADDPAAAVAAMAGEAALTEAEARSVAAYSEKARDLSELLEANLWVEQATGSQIRFGRGYFVETGKDGQRHVGKLVLGDPFTASSDAKGEVVECAAICESGPVVVEVARVTAEDGELRYVKSSAFGTRSRYELTGAAGAFEVSRPDDYVVDYIGGDKALQEMAESLRDWAAVEHPSARRATWDGTAKLDYMAGTVEVAFTLDDRATSKARIVCRQGGEGFEIKG